jgi:Uma2 family endonuclease
VVPDWACEILSPSTRSYDLQTKRPFYARIGIRHLWLIDPDERSLAVSERVEGRWVEQGTYRGDELVRDAPFEALELRLGLLWPGLKKPLQAPNEG